MQVYQAGKGFEEEEAADRGAEMQTEASKR